jgi:hypothetical protein
MSLRDQILSANDTGLHPVVVPEWGNVTVYVPVIALADNDEVKLAAAAADKTIAAAIFAMRDADGNKLFTDADADALRRKSLAAVNRVIGEFNKVNGFNDEDDPAKNSETTPGSDSN